MLNFFNPHKICQMEMSVNEDNMNRKSMNISSSKKSNNHVRKISGWVIVSIFSFSVVIFVIVVNRNRTTTNQGNLDEINLKVKTAISSVNRGSVIHREIINNVDVIWESPIGDVSNYKGIIFLAHGCHHAHTDFWSSNNSSNEQHFECSECLGLPEEKAIVRIAIDTYKLVVVTVSSDNRDSGCWSTNIDSIIISNILKTFQDRFYNILEGTSRRTPKKERLLPIIAFGASSGGSFVSQLGDSLNSSGTHLDGYISQISAYSKQDWKHYQDMSLRCSVYITMNRDVGTNDNAIKLLSTLSSMNSSIVSKHIRLPPLPIHESFFSDRIDSISFDTSKRIFEALLQNDMIALYKDSDGYDYLNLLNEKYYLTSDPRMSDWRIIIGPIVSDDIDTLEPDLSPISEVFNVAYAMHEMSRDGVNDALQFCLQQFGK